ncbi:MAG: B-box zinc finger protein, partial [Verrucomicrobiota bacterium]
MKIQCACGAKYAFDATPEMLQNPVRFVCPTCGLDSSDYVNDLIRREFAGQTPPIPAAPTTKSPRLKISLGGSQSSAPVEEAAPAPAAEEHCAKHPRELAADHCVVCGKPMCPQCMKLFGHVCSPLCRAKAEAQNINIPVYSGQSSVAEARYWRKVGAIGGSIAAVLVAALGFWTWYAWIGSQPHVAFSIRFDDRAYAGESRLCGTNQIVFLHGGTLARCDIKSKKERWSQELVTKQQIAELAAREYQSQPNDRYVPKIPQNKIEEMVARGLESELQLRVSGQNVWVRTPGKLTHYDWDTGKVLQEIPLAGRTEFISRNDEFLIMGAGANGQALVTHINPANGESRVEQIGQPGQTMVAQNSTGTTGNEGVQPNGGLPLTPGTGPMNPAKVAEQAQNMSTPGRIALPALLANSSEQERILAELKDQDQTRPGKQPPARQPKPAQNETGDFTLIPSQNGYVQFAVRLLESHIVTREAMKAPPAKSALDSGNVGVMNETAAVNEQLNEMQRNRGGDKVSEDESLYQVSLRRPDSNVAADW